MENVNYYQELKKHIRVVNVMFSSNNSRRNLILNNPIPNNKYRFNSELLSISEQENLLGLANFMQAHPEVDDKSILLLIESHANQLKVLKRLCDSQPDLVLKLKQQGYISIASAIAANREIDTIIK